MFTRLHAIRGAWRTAYDVQRQRLTTLYRARGIDVFATNVLAVWSPEGSVCTVCVWRNSIESWLFECYGLMLMTHEQLTQAHVKRNNALRFVDSWMEEIEDLDPKRSHVTEFPDDSSVVFGDNYEVESLQGFINRFRGSFFIRGRDITRLTSFTSLTFSL